MGGHIGSGATAFFFFLPDYCCTHTAIYVPDIVSRDDGSLISLPPFFSQITQTKAKEKKNQPLF